MVTTSAGATIPEVTHHRAEIAGADVHYVTAGTTGSPVLLVHGFPESWWAFHAVIPLLAERHRVIAVDLPGSGDSSAGSNPCTSASSAQALRELIEVLDLGPVHLTGQDIGGVSTFRLAARHPDLVRSLTAIETTLPGYGMERFADVADGGMWHVGFLATPGIPQMLLAGREREFLTGYALPAMCTNPAAISERDVDELVRTYARPDGLRGTTGFYGSMLTEGEEIQAIAAGGPLSMPVLAIDAAPRALTRDTMNRVAAHVTTVTFDDVGHLVAMEAPERLAAALLDFYRPLD